MRCPYCDANRSQVRESRSVDEGHGLRRRRVCLSCEGKFTTMERTYLRPLTVLKRDGGRQPFNDSKLAQAIRVATRKRDITEDHIQALVSSIREELERRGDDVISSDVIGDVTLDRLRETDDVAYVRFASVYRAFSGLRDFRACMEQLKDNDAPGQ